jgi:hypothetical protein
VGFYICPPERVAWSTKPDNYDSNLKTWIVIGYSFNDEFILNMFREALRIGDHRLTLVSPR